jgi:hypothetical protein
LPTKPRNDLTLGVTKFCLAMEEHRRSHLGRVKSPKEFLDTFFPFSAETATDRIFLHIPREVRGPIVSGWGIRGRRAALADDDEKTRSTVHDALTAGDIDENVFEEGISATTLIDWIPLTDFWSFWRSGRIAGAPVQRALAVARELSLFDDRWLLDNVRGRGGRLSGTDVICDTLSKEQVVAWVKNVHASGDGSPRGLVAAIGWEVVLSKTSQEALLFVLDAFARKVGLAPPAKMPSDAPPAPSSQRPPPLRSSDPSGLRPPRPPAPPLPRDRGRAAIPPGRSPSRPPEAAGATRPSRPPEAAGATRPSRPPEAAGATRPSRPPPTTGSQPPVDALSHVRAQVSQSLGLEPDQPDSQWPSSFPPPPAPSYGLDNDDDTASEHREELAPIGKPSPPKPSGEG